MLNLGAVDEAVDVGIVAPGAASAVHIIGADNHLLIVRSQLVMPAEKKE